MNKSNELGNEFLENYEKSIDQFKSHLELIKQKVFEYLQSEKDTVVRDIKGILIPYNLK